MDAITTLPPPKMPDDLAEQALDAVRSPNLAALIEARLSHFDAGHSQQADDAVSYAQLMNNANRMFWQPMMERTRKPTSPAQLRAAAKAANKFAAMLLAFADKASREAATLEEAEKD